MLTILRSLSFMNFLTFSKTLPADKRLPTITTFENGLCCLESVMTYNPLKCSLVPSTFMVPHNRL